MRDQEFIHSTNDIASTLFFMLDAGFQVMVDEPQAQPQPHFVTPIEVPHYSRGVFTFIRPEWVFGPFQTLEITKGYHKGKHFVCDMNYASVGAYFQGERSDKGRRRFGSCVVGYKDEWLEKPATILRPNPPEVEEWYKRIVAHLSSGIVIKAGVHRYHVGKGVLADPDVHECLPPFDWIPWTKELLTPKVTSSKKKSGRKKKQPD